MNISVTLTSGERAKALEVLRDGIQEMIAACEVFDEGEHGEMSKPSSRDVDRKTSDMLDELMGVLGIESATASRW